MVLHRHCSKGKKVRKEAHAQAQATVTLHHPFNDGSNKPLLIGPKYESNAEQKEGVDGQTGQQSNSPARSTFSFNVRSLAALLLPVSLETLNYTSMFPFNP